MIPVLPPECTLELETIEILSVLIPPKTTQTVLKVLERFPLELYHLKRIRKLNGRNQVLLGLADSPSLSEIKSTLEKEYQNHVHLDPETKLDYKVVKVSKWPAYTKTQYQAWNCIWPMSFHSNVEMYFRLTLASKFK
jgi:tRNA-specific adenosine deaminase 3